MRELLRTTVFFMLLFCISPGCRKDTNSTDTQEPPASSTGSARYSGSWRGVISVSALYPDLCAWNGDLVGITQNWTVMGDSVHVEDIAKDNSGTYTYYWHGTIRNDTLEMISKRDINCFGEAKSLEIVVKAPILSLIDKYSIETSAVYSPCPPDCVFVFNYIISKTK